MKRVAFAFIFFLLLTIVSAGRADAQCAMCTVSAEQSVKNGNTQGLGLNSGVIYLLAVPYLMISGLGILWYFKYRKGASGYARNI